ncbi:unnamed protein product, partial [marine sediment metagenome]
GLFYSDTTFGHQRCNVDHPLTQASMGFPVEIGNTGNGFRAMQVEWDETRPPDGWPP